MPEGEKRKMDEERISHLSMQGSVSSEASESLIEEIAESSEIPETATKLATAVYVRVATSGQEDAASITTQEAACAKLAESLGYQVDDAYVYRDAGSGGGADA